MKFMPKRKLESLTAIRNRNVRVKQSEVRVMRNQLHRQILAEAETKYLDTYNAGAAPAAGGTVVLLNNPAAGTDFNQRTGRHIESMYVDVEVCVRLAAAPGVANTAVGTMLALVVDTMPATGTAPTAGQVFETVNTGSASVDLSNVSQYGDRFHILWKERTTVYAGTTQPFQVDNGRYHKFIKIPQAYQKVEFNTTPLPTANALYLVYFDDSNLGSATSTALNINARYAYKDF